jgi:hypothetical protein
MIHYPAIIKLEAQDELIYLASASDFLQQYQQQYGYFTAEDLLIDARGHSYQLQSYQPQQPGQPPTAPTPLTKHWSLTELQALVQAHFFSLAQSCVVKIQAPSIPALFELLADKSQN